MWLVWYLLVGGVKTVAALGLFVMAPSSSQTSL